MKIVNGQVTGMAFQGPKPAPFSELIGKPESEAIAAVKASGPHWITRIVDREGVPQVGTCEVNNHRVNLSIMAGKVVRIAVG